MAVNNRPPLQKLLFHSGRGIQYAYHDFTKLIDSCSTVERSMSRKGNCWDNAVAESFFKPIKVEHIYKQKFTSKKQAALFIFGWIETKETVLWKI